MAGGILVKTLNQWTSEYLLYFGVKRLFDTVLDTCWTLMFVVAFTKSSNQK